MARNAALIRCLRILRHLEAGHRVTMQACAERFRVHQRTIRRDLEALEAAGVPLTHQHEYKGSVERAIWWIP